MPPAATRRQFVLALALGAAGAGLVLLAVRQGWARVDYLAPAPLPSQRVAVTGQEVEPAAGALALAGLACLAAVIATRGALRRAAGVVLTGFGVAVAATVSGPVRAAHVLAVAASQVASPSTGIGGSTTSGKPTTSRAVVVGGSVGHAVLTAAPWRAAVLLGGLAMVAAGVWTIWRGPAWPVMSSRFDRPGDATAAPSRAATRPSRLDPGATAARDRVDPAVLWDSLSRGVDPTAGSTDLAGADPGSGDGDTAPPAGDRPAAVDGGDAATPSGSTGRRDSATIGRTG